MSEPGAAAPLAPAPPSPDALVRQALRYRNAGVDARAIDILKQALALDPEHLNAKLQLASIYLDQQQVGPAMATLAEADRQAPNSPIVRRLMALGRLQRRELRRARADADEAVRLGPQDGVSHTILGRVLTAQQRWKDADAELLRGVELAPDSAYALVHRGYFLLARRRVKEAAAVADEAGRAAPDDLGVMLLRGDAALRSGRDGEARDFALWALSQRPGSRHALRLLISVKTRQSWLLGLWWRMNMSVWLHAALVVALIPFGLWFLPAIYLVIGRAIFDHMLKREVKTVELKPEF
jgi:tetratricopeptide (TPR) repeat protein